ncbi:MoeB/ThiF family adenylyltransferase [Fictibacillus aquaticus]|uniref:Thiamine biosynthesis protein MoeB n=1 Tax=Fictibacillus aquaticus TaxID=2021314 RepID=A0A235F4Q1_9BACL|nr:MoeB/ThiF family adenylyltransferase [Fictibacillus aquaticus]OYD56194.1 thiamine biosynthesis protein MoeB [Fictibacillus aquaticus]
MHDRYSRQTLFKPIGTEGQASISSKHVLLIGAGALGTGNAEALVRAGVGKLTIVDRDYVEASNLQRQQLYSERDAAERIPKAAAAKSRLEAVNSDVTINAIIEDVSFLELEELADDVDLIIDATDNFETRLILNDVSQKYKIPWIYGACVGSYGMTFTVVPDVTPCFQCLWKSTPSGGQTCDTAGIISPAVGMVVAYQAAEALKVLVGDYEALRQKLVTFNLWSNMHSEVGVSKLKKNDCPSCGENPVYPFLSKERLMNTSVLCGRDTVQLRPASKIAVDLKQLETKLSQQGMYVQRNPYLLSIFFDDHRMAVFYDGRVLVHGTKDVIEAKKIYHRIFG